MTGREQEQKELERLYNSDHAQLVAIYGKQRVGKTFLVDECFKGKITFRHSGLSPLEYKDYSDETPLKTQLKHFHNSLILHGMSEDRKCPDNWLDAFFQLELLMEKTETAGKQVIFLDELPWMDTHKSGFITAFEGFWNTWGCHRDNLMVIVCGSATSWMSDKLINNHGGLYNRLTYEIKLSPFTLKECEQYLSSNGIRLSRYDIAQAYMITGGIPYYLSYFQKGKSLSQNIDALFFSRNAKLRNEFGRLFFSIFSNPDTMMSIIRFLSTRNAGYTRKEIADALHSTPGGSFTQALCALIESDFIIKYVPFGLSGKPEYYKLVDPFCMFYIKFVDNNRSLAQDFWQQNQASQSIVTWRGFAFENVCFNHIGQIKQALGISGVSTTQSAWSKREDDEEGTQIDLLISRKDNIVNMCEIKFYGNDFTVTKEYYRTLLNRQELLSRELTRKTMIHNTLITTFGLKYNEYSTLFDNVVTLDALFN